MKKYRFKNTIFLFTSSILLVACTESKQKENEISPETKVENSVQLTDAQLKNAAVSFGKLEKRTISSTVKVNGLIDVPPQNLISISAPLGGFLKSTKLLPGMHISKGETIAVMEDQQYIQLQQEYLTTETNLAFAESEFKRQKELNQSKAASDKVAQQAESTYKSLKITLRSLSEKLKLIGVNPEKLNENNLSRAVTIPSPIDGYVSSVNVNIGKYVNPTDVLFELINPDDIHLALTVFEKDLDKISIGQKLKTYTNTNPDKKYTCEIILIGKDLSNERSIQVHCHFDKMDKSLIPGMFMNAEIDVNSTNAFTVPEDALINFEGKNYLFVSSGKNQFQIVEAECGIKENGFIEIKNSPKFESKSIVIKGAYTLLMKMKNKSDE